MEESILSVENLQVFFDSRSVTVRAVNGADYRLHRGMTLGLVGESGCGKTVSALAVLRLLETPPARYHGGKILFNGTDLLHLPEKEIRKIRGNSISMIFQEPMTSLNPVLSVGFQIGEVLRIHRNMNCSEIRNKTAELLKMVGIPDPLKRIAQFPHHLSGGMRQRVMIALALACNPQILIADEPTTALDVTIQAQILDLLADLQSQLGTSILMITHDMGAIAESAHRVAVMYAGKIVEEGDVQVIFKNPCHPYTQRLLEAIPRLDHPCTERLKEIPGMVADPCALPPGCAFFNRCPEVKTECRFSQPELKQIETGHTVRCWSA
jgi:oligopeptide/dipeptide ABC transporter ATP-binding protein